MVCAAATAGAQTLPSEPIAFADGRGAVGGDVSVSLAPQDPGFFNYTDYEHNALRMLKLDVSASFQAGPHVELLGDIRSESLGVPRPYGLYVRVRPWLNHAFDIQAGQIPPTFGAFPRRTYAADNPLIGYPLAYQYLTSIRPDALPATADDLLRMRARGWLSSFPLGSQTPAPGLPLVTAFRWDTGVQAHASGAWLDATGGVTVGTVSNPRFRDNNSGKQIVGRLAFHPTAGLVIGVSAARAPFASSGAARAAGIGDSKFVERALGADVEYSRDYYLIRFETVVSDRTLPSIEGVTSPLRSVATSLEGKYKLRPGFYLAARLDHVGFSTITGSERTDTWDANLTRVEAGGGYSIQRNLIAKLTYQYNTRDGGRVRTAGYLAGQLLFWF